MSQPHDIRPRTTTPDTHWDLHADVVIAGYGIAGVTAAIEAARAGADVLVLERTSGWGGAATMAGGFIYLGGGTPLQHALGFEDTPDNMERFMTAALGPGVDKAKIADYCAGSVEHYAWLVDCGVRFKEEFWGEPGWEPPHDEGLMYTGGEDSAPFNEIAVPAPRGHVPQMDGKQIGVRGGGYMLMKPLVELAERLGVRVQYDVRCRSLATDDTGRVTGIIAARYGDELTVRADRGVVLATGSFAYNDRMVERHAPRLLGRPAAAIEEHDGRAILMAQALGADVAHMDATEAVIFADPQMLARGILVNGRGQRYVPEDTYGGRIAQLTLLQQDDQAYLILDETAYEEAMTTETATPFFRRRPKWVAETAEELEAEIGLPAHSLRTTLDLYNLHAANGTDPVLGKKPRWLRPIGLPVAAYDLRGCTAGFTLGGLRTDLRSRVLHLSGDPIPGLYAAGRCTSGVCAGGYASGTSLGDGSFYGRRAGQTAARP
ncbi:FAD-dependent oxidoreductase [Actinocorallia longicatena]